MKTRFQHAVAAAAMAASLSVAPLAAAADKPQAKHTKTVHVNSHLGSGFAREVNELHARMEADGWRFVSLVPHTENRDTEGLWVTYVCD